MSKFIPVILLSLTLLLLAVIYYPIIGEEYRKDHLYQPEIQSKILKRNFVKVQPQNGQVLLTPSANNSLLGTSEGDFFREPKPLSVRSQFRARDQHWGAVYTVKSIEADGVVIDYSSGSGNARKGTVKLPWK